MRRLPIFFVLDVSESMIGTQLTQLEEGMSRIVSSLRKDPSALETVYISVIAFAGKSKVISPLIDVVSFYPPRLPIGGGTSLGSALDVLMNEIDKKVVKQTSNVQGDWKPIVFLITDGQPTDNSSKAIEKWTKEYANKATMVAITLGHGADTSILKKLTPNVLIYEGSSDDEFRKFVDWISNSVKMQSQKADAGKGSEGIDLTKISDNLSFSETDEAPLADPNTVVLTGRCKTKKSPYLIKYSRMATLQSLEKYTDEIQYNLEGCFPITEDYFNWSSENDINEIDASSLIGIPGCPHCGNRVAFAVCGHCEKIMCIDGQGKAICPWCDQENNFVPGDGDFNVRRGQG